MSNYCVLLSKGDGWWSKYVWTNEEESSEMVGSTEEIGKYDGVEEGEEIDEKCNENVVSKNLTFLEMVICLVSKSITLYAFWP